MSSEEIKGIAESVWDAAFGADNAVSVIADALQTIQDRADELLAQRDALIHRLEVWQPRTLEAEADAKHWEAEADRLYERLCLYEDVKPPQRKGLEK